MSGPECCSNPPILSPTAGNGTVEKVGGLHCYLTASPHSNLAVLMLSDVFGYEAPLLNAKVVVELAKSRLIQTAVLLHPSFVSVDDFKAVDTPIAILGAESDKYFPPELVKEFEEILAAKPGVWSFVKIHPGVEHGWAVRYNTEDAEAVKAAEEAHKDCWIGLLNILRENVVQILQCLSCRICHTVFFVFYFFCFFLLLQFNKCCKTKKA